MKLYGISNCSTVKKSCDWLSDHSIEFIFHDFKKHGLDEQAVQNWFTQTQWQNLINRSGLTWRGLSEQRKLIVQDDEGALKLMLEKVSVIKRPILLQDGKLLHIGFNIQAYEKIFGFR